MIFILMLLIMILALTAMAPWFAESFKNEWKVCYECGLWFCATGERFPDPPISITHPEPGLCPHCKHQKMQTSQKQ